MPEIGDDPSTLRKLASWYRQFAERAGNPAVWEARLRTAEDLDAQAERVEQRVVAATGLGSQGPALRR